MKKNRMVKYLAICLLGLIGCIRHRIKPAADLDLIAIGHWGPLTQLTFCVASNFGKYRYEIETLAAGAARDWSDYGGIEFVRRPQCDGQENVTLEATQDAAQPRGAAQVPQPGQRHVTMTLKMSEGYGQLIANGSLLKDRAYGVLLHEFGHVLGFDHEHDGPVEKLVTDKDSRSVMYYPWEAGRHHRRGWADGWDHVRMSILDKIGMMTHYPPSMLQSPTNAMPQVVSEEQGESHCPSGTVMIGLACYGQYCDDKRIFCASLTGRVAPIRRHESDSLTEKTVGLTGRDDGFISGVQCRGAYCSTLKLVFTEYLGSKPQGGLCYVSEGFSSREGQSGQGYNHICKKNHAVTGLECEGPYCGTIRLRCCSVQMVPIR